MLATAPLCISLEVNQTAPSNEQVANDSSVLELSGATVSLTCACTGLSSNTLLLEWYDSSGALVANGTGTAMLDIALYADATYECREGGVLVHVVNLVAVGEFPKVQKKTLHVLRMHNLIACTMYLYAYNF